jgi:cell division protein FtsN
MPRHERRPAQRPAEKSRSSVKGVLVGVFLGLLVAALMAWYLVPRDSDFRKVESAQEIRLPPTSISSQAAKEPTPQVAPAASQPDPSNYTFYDILPGDKTPKPLPAKPANEQWWLQVAALKNAADADALRARLTLLNLSAVTQPTTGEPPLHRVRVGPFQTQDAASAAQKTLTANKLEARLLKEPATQ